MENFETTGAAAEVTADQQSAFLQGWESGGTSVEETADQQDTAAEQAQEVPADDTDRADQSETATEQAESETTQEAEPTVDASDAKSGQEEPTWLVKHLDTEKTLKASDITTELLQKGLDYDRVRTKYDEAKPVIDLFAQYAKQAGMSLSDYAKHIRQEAKRASGMSQEEAARTVELEDREAAVSAKESAQQESRKAEDARQAKVQADLAEFQKAFPDVYEQARSNPKAIPQSVWDEVNRGEFSLTSAYSRYAVSKANQEAEAARKAQQTSAQNQRNAARSTGSQKSAGNDTKTSNAFLDGFYSG